MTFYRKKFGKGGEDIASQYFIDNGFTILLRNFRTKFGEIDIIAQKNQKIYFVEVKTRSNTQKGYPYEAINKKKIGRMQRIASYFLITNNYKNSKYTLAAISILFLNDSHYQIRFFDSII